MYVHTFHFYFYTPSVHENFVVFIITACMHSCRNTYQGTSGVCYNTTEPEFDGSLWEILPRFVIGKVGSAIEKLKKRGVTVEYLNITQLSSYRDDAHPSVYLPFWKTIDPKARDPDELSDCVHWCLPGVPDVWNQILYGYIMEP